MPSLPPFYPPPSLPPCPLYPPFAPLPNGVAIISRRASVVRLTFTLETTIESLAATAAPSANGGGVDAADAPLTTLQALGLTLRRLLACEAPACQLSVRVRAGSLAIDALLTILTADEDASPAAMAATASAANATVAAVSALAAAGPASLSLALGANVTSLEPPTVHGLE